MKITRLICFSLYFIIFMLFTHCDTTTEEPENLTETIEGLQTEIRQLKDENNYLKKEISETFIRADSIKSLYQATLEAQAKKPELSNEEKRFVALIAQLNDAVSTMIETNQVEPVLDFFYDRYTSNVVQVSLSNEVKVDRQKSATMGEYLKTLASDQGIASLRFWVNDILEVDIRNNELGVLIFTNNFEARMTDGRTIDGEDLVQVVAKKYSGKWKIGNYSSIFLSDYERLVSQ